MNFLSHHLSLRAARRVPAKGHAVTHKRVTDWATKGRLNLWIAPKKKPLDRRGESGGLIDGGFSIQFGRLEGTAHQLYRQALRLQRII